MGTNAWVATETCIKNKRAQTTLTIQTTIMDQTVLPMQTATRDQIVLIMQTATRDWLVLPMQTATRDWTVLTITDQTVLTIHKVIRAKPDQK